MSQAYGNTLGPVEHQHPLRKQQTFNSTISKKSKKSQLSDDYDTKAYVNEMLENEENFKNLLEITENMGFTKPQMKEITKKRKVLEEAEKMLESKTLENKKLMNSGSQGLLPTKNQNQAGSSLQNKVSRAIKNVQTPSIDNQQLKISLNDKKINMHTKTDAKEKMKNLHHESDHSNDRFAQKRDSKDGIGNMRSQEHMVEVRDYFDNKMCLRRSIEQNMHYQRRQKKIQQSSLPSKIQELEESKRHIRSHLTNKAMTKQEIYNTMDHGSKTVNSKTSTSVALPQIQKKSAVQKSAQPYQNHEDVSRNNFIAQSGPIKNHVQSNVMKYSLKLSAPKKGAQNDYDRQPLRQQKEDIMLEHGNQNESQLRTLGFQFRNISPPRIQIGGMAEKQTPDQGSLDYNTFSIVNKQTIHKNMEADIYKKTVVAESHYKNHLNSKFTTSKQSQILKGVN